MPRGPLPATPPPADATPAPAAPPASAPPRPSEVTLLLSAASAGDTQAMQRLLGAVYDELRAIAQQRMGGERRFHTLQATALVHEAYLRLFGKEGATFENRAHFFHAAADAMRKVLIDHARARNAQKRGGGRAALQVADAAEFIDAPDMDGFLALDDAISRLEGVDPEAAAVVRLRFFAGLSEAGIGAALGLSERTVRRDWAFARAWLRDTLERETE